MECQASVNDGAEMRHTQNKDEPLKPGEALIEVKHRRYARGSGEPPRWEFLHYTVDMIEKETPKRLHMRGGYIKYDKAIKQRTHKTIGSNYIYTLIRYEPRAT